jgi:hypothetical protein
MFNKLTDFELSFSAQGGIKQIIRVLNDKYTPNQISDLIKSGEALTTIMHDKQGGGYVYLTNDLSNDDPIEAIAVVLEQEAMDEMEFDFDI